MWLDLTLPYLDPSPTLLPLAALTIFTCLLCFIAMGVVFFHQLASPPPPRPPFCTVVIRMCYHLHLLLPISLFVFVIRVCGCV